MYPLIREQQAVKSCKGMISPLILGIGLIIVIALALVYFLAGGKTAFPDRSSSNKNTAASSFPSLTPAPNIYQADDFSIVIPERWQKSSQPLPGSLLTIYKINEDHLNDLNAQKINFKSYLAVSFDNRDGRTKPQLLDLVRQSLTQISPNAKFSGFTESTINDQPADFGELDITQQNVNYKVLIALIIKGDKFFTISANTTTLKWPGYKDLLYQTAKSIKLK